MLAKKIAFYRIISKVYDTERYKEKLDTLERKADESTLRQANEIVSQYDRLKTPETARTQPTVKNGAITKGDGITHFSAGFYSESSKGDIVESILQKEIAYDTRKSINRSSMRIDPEIVERIEKEGVAIEIIEELGIPIFKYKGQITLHGVFDIEKGYARVGGYKSIIQNKNKTIGVLYIAVDKVKKDTVRNSLYLAERYESYLQKNENIESTIHWTYYKDSKGTELRIIANLDDKDRRGAIDKLKVVYNNIPDLFIGDKTINLYNYYGSYMCIISIDFKAIYERNLWAFIGFLTNGIIKNPEDYDKIKLFLENIDKQKKERENKLAEEANEKYRQLRIIVEDESPYEQIEIEDLAKKSVKECVLAVVRGNFGKDYNEERTEITKISVSTAIKIFIFYRENNQKKWRMSTEVFENWDEVKNYKQSGRNYGNMLKETFADSINHVFSKIKQAFLISISENKIISSYSGSSSSKSAGATSTSYTVSEKIHDKTGEKIYIVRMSDRVEKDTYYRISAAIKKLGGYYSKYGDVKGFVLKNKPTDEQLKEIFG